MTTAQLSKDLEGTISAGLPLRQIVSILREYRIQGVTRGDVQLALEALRGRARDEASEERILEVMDVVSGFCSREYTVREDPEPPGGAP